MKQITERTYQSTIGVLIIIILGLVVWIAQQHAALSQSSDQSMQQTESSSSATTMETTLNTATPPVTSVGGDSVSISNQAAGMQVAVASVTLSQPSWVAIRDNTGRTLGAALFDTGTETNVSVPLLRATVSGQNYQALLYADDGDRQFDLDKDVLITSDGSVAGTTFSTQ